MVDMVQALFPFLLNGQSRSSLFRPFGPNAWLVDWVECFHPHTHQTRCKRLSALTLFPFLCGGLVHIYILKVQAEILTTEVKQPTLSTSLKDCY